MASGGAPFPKAARLLRRSEFTLTMGEGCRVYTRRYVVFVRFHASGESRLGVTVSRKVGSAPVRNRIKRCLREAFRLQRASWPRAADVVIIAKQPKAGEPRRRRAEFDLDSSASELAHAIRVARGRGASGKPAGRRPAAKADRAGAE